MEIVLSWQGRRVRSVVVLGVWWCVGSDLCAALGIANAAQALARLPAHKKTTVTKLAQGICDAYTLRAFGHSDENDTTRWQPDQILVSESGAYELVITSRSPAARPFVDWLTDEVLPTIRRFGCYPAPKRPVSVHVAAGIVRVIQKEEIDRLRSEKKPFNNENAFNDRVAERVEREHPECRFAFAWFFSHRHKHEWTNANLKQLKPPDDGQLEFEYGYESVTRDGEKDVPVRRDHLRRAELLQLLAGYNGTVRGGRRMAASAITKVERLVEVYQRHHPDDLLSDAELRAAAPDIYLCDEPEET